LHKFAKKLNITQHIIYKLYFYILYFYINIVMAIRHLLKNH